MKRGTVAAALTVLFALAAAAGVFLYVRSVREGSERAQRTVEVIVATTDIPAGAELDELIDAGMFVKENVPQDDLVRAAITDAYQLEGRRTAYPILAGEQISAARLEGTLQAAGGRFGLVGGAHALSLTLEPQRAAGGVLQQGDHVEAFGTFKSVANPQSQLTRVLVVDAEVLTVIRETETGSRAVTVLLAVTPQEAQLLIYAQEQGHVWLTLLPPNEPGVLIPPVRAKELR
jgi:Flp pilus assembly protein CpaB